METMAPPSWRMSPPDLDRLVQELRGEVDEVIGPAVDDGVIRLRPIEGADDLPLDITDDQGPGTYRLVRSDGSSAQRSARAFAHGVGPDSLKALVQPPRTPVWAMDRAHDGEISVTLSIAPVVRRAVIGVRACDLAALARLDRTQLDGPFPDPAYARARAGLVLVAVDCSQPAATCFCGSTGTGPTVEDGGGGADLVLTEIDEAGEVWYLLRAFTERGRVLAAALELEEASAAVSEHVEQLRRGVRTSQRSLRHDAAAVVLADLAHPRWDDVAERCLTCGNCTAVCPTCFCTDTDDRIDLDGHTAHRDRVWDTCFSGEYSHLGAGPARASARSRYRQWLTHKLGTWYDQFGESGCVGCGRCITWCPVGIDLTAEIDALAGGDQP